MIKNYKTPQCEEIVLYTESALLIGSAADAVDAGSLGYYENERWTGEL